MSLEYEHNMKPLWLDTSNAAPTTRVLTDDLEADVLIIGAGNTGISSAIHLAKAGKKVVVLEAKEIGHGGSGTNNGMLIPALSSAYPNELRNRFGVERGERFAKLIAGCAQEAFQLIRSLNIKCEAVQNGWVQPAHSPGRAKLAQARFEQWQALGANVAYLDQAQVSDITGSRLYYGGWFAAEGGHVNPLSLIRGLADAAIKQGVQIYTQSPVLSVTQTNAHWVVATQHAKVNAHQIILATDAYSGDLFPNIPRSFVAVKSWQLATTPLPEHVTHALLKNNIALSDSHADLHFAHLTSDNRLISGGKLFFEYNAQQRMKNYTAKRICKMFPAIPANIQFDYVWNGLVGITVDFTPRLHQLAPGVLTVMGYSGRGAALGISMGRILAEATLGQRHVDDLDIPLTQVKPIPCHTILKKLAILNLLYYRWKDSREIRV